MRKLVLCVGTLAALGGMLGSAGAASAATNNGQSGWNWGNPRPQGNTINDVQCVSDTRCYATGDFGTALRSDDGGETWTGLATGITANLGKVALIGGDSFVIGGGCAARRSDDGGATFRRLPFSATDFTCPSPLRAISFASSDEGYLLFEDGSLARTPDGGRTFSRRTAVPGANATSPIASDIAFVGPNTGFALVGGSIYRTSDGATSWTLVASGAQQLNSIVFTDAANGYIVGNGNTVLRTIDGGGTWSPRPITVGGAQNLTRVRCAGPTLCLITNESGIGLHRTQDGGATFTFVVPTDQQVFAATYASPTRAMAMGKSGVTVLSDNGGASWRRVGGSISDQLRGVRATNAQVAYAFGLNGALARTLDGGETWEGVGAPTSASIVDVSFPSDQTGFALDETGQLFRTDNAAASWQILNTGTTTAPSAVITLDAQRVVLVGPRGARRSVNGGGEFSPVNDRAARGKPFSAADRAGPALFLYGSRALVVSVNGGKTFRAVPRPVKGGVESYDFINANIGFAVDGAGRVWKTGNRGRRWTELQGVGTNQGYALSFGSRNGGYLAITEFGSSEAPRGYVLRTSDGGRTWRPQLVDANPLTSLSSPGGGTDFALGGTSNLFTTFSGGDQGIPSRLRIGSGSRTVRGSSVTIRGRLGPAEGGEEVVLSGRSTNKTRWTHKLVKVASNGTFTTSFRVSRDSVFVAQWAGSSDRNGASSGILRVRKR